MEKTSKKFACENPMCTKVTSKQCNDCVRLGVSSDSNIGRFCSKACQKEMYSTHRFIHKAIRKANKGSINDAAPVTIALAIKEASIRKTLPDLPRDNILSILMVNCRDWVEGAFDYSTLFTSVKNFVFPLLQRIDITMYGTQTTSVGTHNYNEGLYSITRINGSLDDTLKNCDKKYDCAVLFQPGLSDHIIEWNEIIQNMVKSNITTIVTRNNGVDKWRLHALIDEQTLVDYFGANIIAQKIKNPAISHNLLTFNGGRIPYAYYIILKGKNQQLDDFELEQQVIDHAFMIDENRKTYLNYLGKELLKIGENQNLGTIFLNMASNIDNNIENFPVEFSLKDLEEIGKDRSTHPQSDIITPIKRSSTTLKPSTLFTVPKMSNAESPRSFISTPRGSQNSGDSSPLGTLSITASPSSTNSRISSRGSPSSVFNAPKRSNGRLPSAAFSAPKKLNTSSHSNM